MTPIYDNYYNNKKGGDQRPPWGRRGRDSRPGHLRRITGKEDVSEELSLKHPGGAPCSEASSENLFELLVPVFADRYCALCASFSLPTLPPY